MLHIIAGFTAAALLILAGLWPAITEAREAARFAAFKRRARAYWRREIADEDVIPRVNEAIWLAAFDAGLSPEEAINGVEF